MKRIIKTVDLIFFEDQANGEYGLTHKETYDKDNGFNAFWNGTGIFHDVFEHSHENTHKYFKNEYAMNMGGEMAAMGAMWYYYDCLHISNRLNNNFLFSPSDSMKLSTLNDIKETITYGYTSFGNTLESNVPKQKPTDNDELEYQIDDYWKEIKKCKPNKQDLNEFSSEYLDAIQYKNSITYDKIANLHRYGYRMAEKLIPNNWDNSNTLYDFINYFNSFCKNNNAENLSNCFKGLTIKLYKDENGFVSWKGTLISKNQYEIKNSVLPNNPNHFDIDDCYIIHE